ncbi:MULTISPECIES: hypothetical protein [unclassified Pseudomonas]|uniref:hypothetical protein n=1 Tax=unclassified Pseudomonas TaxID=196821 RepID=UPI00111C443A|nr:MULTISPECIES: hypothetical protein [unclassified Pseudomonas]
MPWLRGGTVAVTAGSTTVVGTNADFAANSRVGDAFVGPDGFNYEIGNIASQSVISIIPAYKGPTVSGSAYAIMPVQGYPKALADSFNTLKNQFGGVIAVLGSDPTQSGVRSALGLSNADGLTEGVMNKYFSEARVCGTPLTGLSLPGNPTAVVATDTVLAALAKLQAQVVARAARGENSDITSLTGLTTPLSREQGGLGGAQGFIEGLGLVWLSGTTIAVRAGSAFVPSVGKVVTYAGGNITPMGVGAVNTFIHLYLTSAGAIEQSTTAAPTRYYNQAHQKTGDASRRYIASILINTNAAGAYQFVHRLTDSSIMYTVASPETTTFRLLNGGTSAAAFNTRTVTPVTAHTLEAAWQNVGSASVRFTPSDAGTPVASGWMVFVPPTAIFNGRCPIAGDGTITYSATGGGSANCYALGYYFDR